MDRLFAFVAAVFFITLFGYVAVNSYSKSQIGVACIEAGKLWVNEDCRESGE